MERLKAFVYRPGAGFHPERFLTSYFTPIHLWGLHFFQECKAIWMGPAHQSIFTFSNILKIIFVFEDKISKLCNTYVQGEYL